VDLEGERDRRHHGAQVGWRVKEKRKRAGGRCRPVVRLVMG